MLGTTQDNESAPLIVLLQLKGHAYRFYIHERHSPLAHKRNYVEIDVFCGQFLQLVCLMLNE